MGPHSPHRSGRAFCLRASRFTRTDQAGRLRAARGVRAPRRPRPFSQRRASLGAPRAPRARAGPAAASPQGRPSSRRQGAPAAGPRGGAPPVTSAPAPPLPALRGHRRGAAPSCRHAAPSPRAGAPPAGPAARTRTYGADGTTVSQPRAAPTPTPTPSALLSQPPARPFPSGTAAASPGQPDARAASGAVSRHPPRGSPHARLPSPGRPSLGPEPRRADAASPPRRR